MPVRPMLLHRMALVSFRLFCKNLGNLHDFFGQMVYRPPWPKIARKPMVKMVLFCNMARTNLSTGETIHTKAPFASRIHEILEGSDINGLSNTMVGRILENLATFQSRGSGWQFMSVFDLTIHTVEYKPLRGNRYIPLPPV